MQEDKQNVSLSRVQFNDDVTLQVKLLGDDDPSKKLLKAFQGAPGLSNQKEPEASFEFLRSQIRVLVYDISGSGMSDLNKPYQRTQRR